MMQRLLQFTLDLFEPERAKPVVSLKPDSRAERPLKGVKKEDFDPLKRPPLAIDSRVFLTPSDAANAPQTLAQAMALVTFRHPRATRETMLGGVLVAYEFRRGKRRTIGFSVGPDGLTVSAPQWVPLYEIDKAVVEKSGWILKKLQETRDRYQRLESARIDWKDGCLLPFLGEQVLLVLDPRHAFGGVGAELKSTSFDTQPAADAALPSLALHVGLPHSATAEQIRDAVQAWLMRQAKRIFIERLDHFAPTLGVQWHKLSLSSAGTRWGSASADGSIRLNWRLVHFNMSVLDYVVVHELSHLRVMDHSPRFWDTVRAVVPDYADLRGQLREQGVPRW